LGEKITNAANIVEIYGGKGDNPIDATKLSKFQACDEDIQYIINCTITNHLVPQV
jgi:hypothetical protein